MADRKRDSKVLTTKAAVMQALGGIPPVSVLTGSKPKNTEMWSRSKTFPSRYFLVMNFALYQKGFQAKPELWGQVTPSDRRQAVRALIATYETARVA